MCQVSAYVQDGETQQIVKENVTRMEVLENGVRIGTLFEAPVDYADMSLKYVDFSSGKIILEKQ